MSPQTILVIGATGTVGGPVAQQLLADGYQMRVLVRDPDRARRQLGPDFAYVQGRVEDDASLKQALENCSGVHISLQAGSNPEDIERVEYRGTVRIAELAAQHGVAHLSFMSGSFVGVDMGPGFLADQAKERAELAIQRSGIPYTIFRPTYFMDNLPKHVQGKRAVILGRQPHQLRLVAARDFGHMVSRAFQTPEAANKVFFVQGPQALTLEEALRIYCELLAPKVRVTTIPLWTMSLLDTLFLKGKMRRTVQIMKGLQRAGEIGDPSEANAILGAPTTTVRQWCTQQQQLLASAVTVGRADQG
jgi:uncharacterized protein YbjT (DUF2867 family)